MAVERYPVFLPGMRITADLLQASQTMTVRKTATEPVTSSTTMQNDDELFAPVEANSVYRVDLVLIHDSATAGDLKIGWTAPGGATMTWGLHGAYLGNTTSDQVTSVMMRSKLIGETEALGGGASTGTTALIRGLLINSSTAGTLQFQFAQNTSSATASNVRSGSVLTLQRIA